MGIRIDELNSGIVVKDDDLLVMSQYNEAVNGLSGTYFNSTNFTNPVLSRIDSIIDFGWGSGSPNPLVNSNNFSVRWEGMVIPKYTETYTFYTISDDNSSLWINDTLIVTNPIGEISGTINLQANVPVNIKLEFIEYTGYSNVQLKWSSSSQTKEIIPSSQLLSNNTQENSLSSRKTLKATALQIKNRFNLEPFEKITELSNSDNNNKIDKTIFNKFLPINGSKGMTGDLYMDLGSSVSKYSAKLLTFNDSFILSQVYNTAVILVDKPNLTGNPNDKVTITINPDELNIGFNVVIIQAGNTLVEILGESGIELWNADGLRTTRGQYSLINVCVLKTNKVWLFGDVAGVANI